MFKRNRYKLRELESKVRSLEYDNRRYRDDYWKLSRKLSNLINHFDLIEVTKPEITVFEKCDP